ncbi:MAG: hypothetical protein WBN20_01900 [Eudoraea sp.]|uniref:hypothetical protein n=1 Tax=Eudoraea sp. TaxID=1979955 RepID=UPI003C789229
MKRKGFLRTTSTFATATALVPLSSCKADKQKVIKETEPIVLRKNWAWDYIYKAKNLFEPNTAEKLPEFIALCKKLDPEGKFKNDYLNLNIYS